jgi:hypothetical protein
MDRNQAGHCILNIAADLLATGMNVYTNLRPELIIADLERAEKSLQEYRLKIFRHGIISAE